MHGTIRKKAIIVHSGGMDSSLCLALAIREHGADNVLSLSFRYGQRHSNELDRAAHICQTWGVDHIVIPLLCLSEITEDALTNHALPIEHREGEAPNTLVVGRNGLMARLASIHAHHLGARCIYMGVIEVESANSGYRDCSRDYMDRMQDIMRIDLGVPDFEIRTPIVKMTKRETMELGHRLGVLGFLLEHTITCYNGLPHAGCGTCPACLLRNEGIRQFRDERPDFDVPFQLPTT